METPARFEATANCPYCDWHAIMFGDEAFDVWHFLDRRLMDHIWTRHERPIPAVNTHAIYLSMTKTEYPCASS